MNPKYTNNTLCVHRNTQSDMYSKCSIYVRRVHIPSSILFSVSKDNLIKRHIFTA